MIDLDRFVVEVDRVIAAIHFYDEIYCNDAAIKIVNEISCQKG